ncbi:hypothetical protein WDW89_11275 [Deltaproteobacteria bacterium TL4]
MDPGHFYITLLAEQPTIGQLLPLIEEYYRVVAFSDRDSGLRHLDNNPCNLLIIEVNNKKFQGFELKKEARKIASSANLIFISPERSMSTVISSQRHGADYLFFLPVEPEPFKKALSILYQRRNYWLDLLRSVSEEK